MSQSNTRKARVRLQSLWKRQSPQYEARLEQAPVGAKVDTADVKDVRDPSSSQANIQTLQALAEHAREEGAVFQSVAVAALQILERVLRYEQKAAAAALSLGQREKLQSMTKIAKQACIALQSSLSTQGAKVKELCSEGCVDDIDDDSSWWFALTEALDVLEEGTEQMASLTSAQPEGSPAHALSRCIAGLLRKHHDALLLEAEQWIT